MNSCQPCYSPSFGLLSVGYIYTVMFIRKSPIFSTFLHMSTRKISYILEGGPWNNEAIF